MNNDSTYRGILESIANIKEAMPDLTEAERRLLIITIFEGYCVH